MKDNEPPLSFHYVLLSSNVECSGLEVAKLGQGSSYPGNTHTEAENEPTYSFSGAESSLRVNR